MFRKSFPALFALMFILASASYLTAAQKEPQPGEVPYNIQGVITHVDTHLNNVTIQTDNNQEQTFPINGDTSIRLNGRKASVAELESGQKVNVTIEAEKAMSVDASSTANSGSSDR
jgi:hypothetical protein